MKTRKFLLLFLALTVLVTICSCDRKDPAQSETTTVATETTVAIESVETTTEPVDTTTAEAPVDTTTAETPVETTEKPVDTTVAEPEKKSCGGFALAAQIVALLGTALTVVVIKKKA